MHRTTRRSGHRPALLAALITSAVVAVAGCSGSGSPSNLDAAGGAAGGSAAEQPAFSAPDRAADAAGGAGRGALSGDLVIERSVIQRASLTVRADDVGRALARAQNAVAAVGGYVATERTEARRNGTPRYSTLTVRVPVDDFDAVLDELGALGTLEEQARSAKDVTGEVIDVESRLASAQAAIKRIRLLLSRAEDLGDVIQLESELSQRQADLEALEAQRSYYADQTTLGTIQLTLLSPDAPAVAPDDDEAGFLAGLSAGWSGLVSTLTGLATVLGAVLPFAVLLLLVGPPVWLLVRALIRRRPRPATTAAGPPSAS